MRESCHRYQTAVAAGAIKNPMAIHCGLSQRDGAYRTCQSGSLGQDSYPIPVLFRKQLTRTVLANQVILAVVQAHGCAAIWTVHLLLLLSFAALWTEFRGPRD